MMNEDDAKIARKLFSEAHSHLDEPLVGKILTPICLSCTNYIFRPGWEPCKCKEFGELPKEYIGCESLDCPQYKLKPNCPDYYFPNIGRD